MTKEFYTVEKDAITGMAKIVSNATSMDDDMDLGLALAQTGETEEEFFSMRSPFFLFSKNTIAKVQNLVK